MKKGFLGTLAAAACLSLTATGAMAVPFVGFPDLEITVSLDIDTGDSTFDGTDVFQGGSLGGALDDGASTPSAAISFLPPATIGSLPIAGTLASFTDFIGLSVGGSGDYITDPALVALFTDLDLDLTNSSAATTFMVTFDLEFDTSGATADGDALSEATALIRDDAMTKFFVDETARADGLFGPPSADLPGSVSFDVIVGPSSTAMLFGEFDIFGTTFAAGAFFDNKLFSTLSVSDVVTLSGPPPPPPPPTTSVPEPGALALFAIGLLGLGAIRRRAIS